MTSKIKLGHGVWFDNQAEEAARFYTSIFPGSSIQHVTRYGSEGKEIHGQPEGAVMTVDFQLSGLPFTALNGGPGFQPNPSISFFVICETREETDRCWEQLTRGGRILTPLDKYEWSDRYGWVQDRYGLGWEICLGSYKDVGQKISPTLLFVHNGKGCAEEALRYYTSIFNESDIAGILHYKAGENEVAGTVKHAMFTLSGQRFMAVDSSLHSSYVFNEAVTIIVYCSSQAEIDYYWEKLSAGGEEGPCGWLKDKFGVSWQVEPVQLAEMLRHPDKDKVKRVTNAFMKMKKFDLAALQKAFDGA